MDNNKQIIRKCDIFGTAFKFSAKYYKFDSASTVKTIMTDKRFDWLFEIDDCQDWCDGAFLMSKFAHFGDFKQGEVADSYALWFLGFFYKYWMITRGTPREVVYKIFPYEVFMSGYEFYHTQGWEYLIDEAVNLYIDRTGDVFTVFSLLNKRKG